MSQRPNILYLHSHDTGRAVGPMGYPVATPNLMKLAEQGLTMRQCFCTNPTCSPSRASLITGRYPHANGMLGLAHSGYCLSDPAGALPSVLRQSGYRTAIVGTQHVMPDERVGEMGYDEQVDRVNDEDRPDDGFAAIAGGAVGWLREAAGKQPFFLSVGFSKPQWYGGPSKDAARMAPLPGLPDSPQTREHAARYHAGIEALDRGMGLVLDALEQAGLDQNTLVVCTTDHGLAIPRHKCNLTDGGLGVFSIWRGPGGFVGGKITDALVSQVDFFPTLCEVAGIDKPAGLQGVSLMPLVSGQREQVREHIFGEVNYHAAYEPQRCVRGSRFKYVRRYDHRNRRVMANCDPSPSRDLLVDQGWADEPMPEESLYDLLLDPGERVNLLDGDGRARREIHAAPLASLLAALAQWMDQTQDPIRQGFIEPALDSQTKDPNVIAKGVIWKRIK